MTTSKDRMHFLLNLTIQIESIAIATNNSYFSIIFFHLMSDNKK